MNNANSQVASKFALFLAGQRLSGSCCRQRKKWDGLKITRSADKLPPTQRIVNINIIYYRITNLFVGCKHGGHSKNVSNNFDPFVFFPDGEGYMYVRPPTSKTEPRKIYIWRGVESP